jgi:hypothetical protein
MLGGVSAVRMRSMMAESTGRDTKTGQQQRPETGQRCSPLRRPLRAASSVGERGEMSTTTTTAAASAGGGGGVVGVGMAVGGTSCSVAVCRGHRVRVAEGGGVAERLDAEVSALVVAPFDVVVAVVVVVVVDDDAGSGIVCATSLIVD